MVQTLAQRAVYAWIQDSMHTLDLMHEYMRILIHLPASEPRLVAVSIIPNMHDFIRESNHIDYNRILDTTQ